MFGNILDSVKGAIFEADGEAPVATQPQAPQGATPAPRPPGSSLNFVPVNAVNPEMVAAIRKQTFSRNTALTQLITASDALVDIIPDPVMRLKAAQKTNGGGRGAKELAEAVQIHLNDVDSAEMQFGQALDTKIKTEVGALENQANTAEHQIQSMNTEIQNLTQRIAQLQQNIGEQTTNASSLRAQVAAKTSELGQAQLEFKAAAEAVRQELNGHKATILSTLG